MTEVFEIALSRSAGSAVVAATELGDCLERPASKVRIAMKKHTRALLVYGQAEHLEVLKRELEAQSIRTSRARTSRQALRIFERLNPPPLVFTDVALPDGTWADVLAHAAKATTPVNVIVVSRLVDPKTYVEVIERGAFDFVAPPFGSSELAHVVRCAMGNVTSRGEAQRSPVDPKQAA